MNWVGRVSVSRRPKATGLGPHRLTQRLEGSREGPGGMAHCMRTKEETTRGEKEVQQGCRDGSGYRRLRLWGACWDMAKNARA